MKIRLANAWKNREEVIRRCKKANACSDEFKRLNKAKTEKEFRLVLWQNIDWVLDYHILDTDLAPQVWKRWEDGYLVGARTNSGRNLQHNLQVLLAEKYKGKYRWIMDSKGYLIRPV